MFFSVFLAYLKDSRCRKAIQVNAILLNMIQVLAFTIAFPGNTD